MDLFQIANVLNNKVKDFELKADMQKYFVSMYPEAEQLEGKEVKNIEEWKDALQAISCEI